MKKVPWAAMLCAVAMAVTGCTGSAAGERVGIITNISAQSGAHAAAQCLAEKAEGHITIKTWPEDYMAQQEQAKALIMDMAADRTLGAMILSEAVYGSAEGLAMANTGGLYIGVSRTAYTYGDDTADLAAVTDMMLSPDMEAMGGLLAQQAMEMGAETLVYYTLRSDTHEGRQLHMQAAKQACGLLGMEFVQVEVPDDNYDAAVPGLAEFFKEDVPARAAQYGRDTAFYGANCAMQEYLLPLVIKHGGIYPQPCCMLCRHSIYNVPGIEGAEAGRIAGYSMGQEELELNTLYTCAERHIRGESTPVQVLAELMEEYAGAACTLRCCTENGREYENYILYTVKATPLG